MGIESGLMQLLGGVAAGAAMSHRQQQPSLPPVQPPTTPPASQAAAAPDTQQVLRDMSGTGQAGGMPGNSQTYLSGPGGVSQGLLTTARQRLYGGS